MKQQRRIELLAPAKDLECALAAIEHGADAIYIGAPRFGARAAAGNSLEDIARLVDTAHLYRVRVYVTVNTLLREEELPDTLQMVWQLHRIGVDALIVQDMALAQMEGMPPIPLHASTQMDNRTPAKVKFLSDAGFRQAVLARELSLQEIRSIHEAVPQMPLEVFVHGALCVSYSGQCYVSESCWGRSANRGECGQFCRLAFTMKDADDKIIARNKHLLSLKDMNRLNDLEDLLDAGVTSLKIEGRLKDVAYVKNVTAAYRQALDAVFKRRQDYARASSGSCIYRFQPQTEKSFSRGATDYFLRGRSQDIFSFDTPKSLGEEMGRFKEARGNYITVAGVKDFNNGDGVCYLDADGTLKGFRINRVDGNKLYPQEMPKIPARALLYRNYDQQFEKLLSRPSAERKIHLNVELAESAFGFRLTLTDEDDLSISLAFPLSKEPARSPQTENLKTQLAKLGNTPFQADQVEVAFTANWFIPTSLLAEWRRTAVERLIRLRQTTYPQEWVKMKATSHPYVSTELTYLGNVGNSAARAFYTGHGVQSIAPAFEVMHPEGSATLMFCRHCLRYAFGWCPMHQQGKSPYREPYYLESSDGRKFRLTFDCKQCQMKVSAEE